MRLIPSKTLVRHAEDSTSPAPSGSWLNYWSETLGIEIPQYGYVKCDCCEKHHLITDFVGGTCCKHNGWKNIYLSNV